MRETLYRAFVTRAGEENAPLIRQILSLKEEQAKILGFDTYAELSLERKMATNVAAVDELTKMLADKARPAAKAELEQLTAYAKARIHTTTSDHTHLTFHSHRTHHTPSLYTTPSLHTTPVLHATPSLHTTPSSHTIPSFHTIPILHHHLLHTTPSHTPHHLFHTTTSFTRHPLTHHTLSHTTPPLPGERLRG